MSQNNLNEEKKIKPIIVPSYLEESKKKEKSSVFLKKLKGIIKKTKTDKEKREEVKRKRKGKMLSQTPHLLPFLQLHDDYILLKKGVMDIMQISSKDLHSLNEGDLQFLLLSRARFLRSYHDEYKLVILNYPSNTEKQKEYWLKKHEKVEDPLRLQFINRKLFEFEFLERERMNREFFLFLYADNDQQLEEKRTLAIRGMQQSFVLNRITKEKKKNVLFLLNNQNTKL